MVFNCIPFACCYLWSHSLNSRVNLSSVSEMFKLPNGRKRDSPHHKCNPRDTARVQTWLNSHPSLKTSRLLLLRPTGGMTVDGNLSWKCLFPEENEAANNWPNWSTEVEWGSGGGEGGRRNKTPGSCQETQPLSPLAPLSSLGLQTSQPTGLSSGSKMNFHFTVVEIPDRHTQIHTIPTT